MTDKEFIEIECRRREEQARFFSNAGKPERERWVVREFLRNLSISASDDELISVNQYDDVDVRFLEANFQLKEIPDTYSFRSWEVRADLDRAKTAVQPKELFDIPDARDIVCVDAYPLILKSASDVRYPPSRRRKLDLLFYITHKYAFLDQSVQPDFSSLGWRSISCLHGPAAYILVSASDAPSFLKVSLPRLPTS
ncbi:MAG: hypothetical protein QOE77_2311 [Blastocatellia bacterium]|jgi:hypothetical protein|nr:hypothetical protein [Blastocatellia bacterium]